MTGTLVKRAGKVAYYGVPGDSGGATAYTRMKGFTELSISKNPKEYSRQYVDEEFEQTDVVGYSPSISYGFDLYEGNAVHDDIVTITDGEKVGSDAVRTILLVDFTSGSETEGYDAIQRNFAVIPDSEGDSMDAYTYGGSFKAKGESKAVKVTVSDDTVTIKTA